VRFRFRRYVIRATFLGLAVEYRYFTRRGFEKGLREAERDFPLSLRVTEVITP